MNLEQFKATAANLADIQPPIAMISGPGVGKTSAIYQLADILKTKTGKNWWAYPFIGSLYESFDATGFNVPRAKPDGTLGALMTEPFWWSGIENADGVDNFCILMLDEFADADDPMQKVLAQIINDRRVGTRHLPRGVWPMLAGNRRKDKSGVKRMATMFQNRFCQVEITYDVKCHLNQMMLDNMHPVGLSFIQKEGGVVYKDEVPSDPGPFYTPRSFEKGMALLDRLARAQGMPASRLPVDTEAQEYMTGWIGATAAGEFFRHVRYADEVPDMKEIVLDPAGCRVPPQLASQYITSFMVAQTCKDAEMEASIEYLMRLKPELQVVAMNAMAQRNQKKGELKTLFTTKQFTLWTKAHQNVVMMTR